ncbi:putative DNA-binding protein [Burkholderia pseudomallei]|nr:hypothetical protein PMC2000_00670 [Burkholderia pseudomallei]CAJ9715025.1 putative DNA-binding protein [Burkholderia pseudomallei]CPF59918.1 putative DNA-binding protein [Burkholderia pseudomallei]CPF94800.1 putative DNA-binding protein [Burkholderia pseudomallei]CPG12155.1 putative DNA-binding protein [Burkholderia pseudomallei]
MATINRRRLSQRSDGVMTNDQTPQERIAAGRQLYAVLKDHLERRAWTPVEGALLLSGIHPPAGCTRIPIGGTGLDGREFASAANDRFHSAVRIMDLWQVRCDDDEENGEITPTELTPYEFIAWCQEMSIETDWMRLFFEVIGGRSRTGPPDLIPPAVIEYATRAADTIGVIQSALTGHASGPGASPPTYRKAETATPRGPMPIPENREHVSTDELAAILAVDPQSIRKRYSQTGSYHGVRPTKLPSRRLLWPVEAVRTLLGRV